MRRFPRVAMRLGLAVPLVVAAACGGPQEPGAEGESCYRDADCAAGLVCVGPPKQRVCSSDVSGLISQVEGPPPMDAGMTEPPPEEDAGGEPPPEQ
jgi:hypothetical protein